MSPLDMASGAQTIANEGTHNEPYYVDYVDNWKGDRVYEHVEQDIPILDRGVALTTIDILKGVLTNGTARNWPLNGIPAAGKTGTQSENTNAWFVGFTRNLTTAVWIGDPNGYTPMQNVPEFEGANENNVQGGRYPAQIWNTYMNPAHQFMTISDWDAPPAPARPPARLYLPGNECLFYVSGYVPQAQPAQPSGFYSAPAAPDAPPTTPPAGTVPPTPTTAPAPVLVPQYTQVDGGNTIPPEVTDPAYPLNTAPIEYVVRSC
jgi:penicillin-binding protein 1A